MLGAIIGDIIGSIYERHPVKNKKFKLFSEDSRFTDDTVMTIATIEAINANRPYKDFYVYYGLKYFERGYGKSFKAWLQSKEHKPYNSWGNGSAMRVSPVGWMFETKREVLKQARLSAECSHNHKEGIKGAQAVALAVFYARKGKSKQYIKEQLEKQFKYDLTRKLSSFKRGYKFDVSCQGSVPEAIICFLESKDFMDAIRNAVALGGDADTMACIAGAIAEAFYGYESIPLSVLKSIAPMLSSQFVYQLVHYSGDNYKGFGKEYFKIWRAYYKNSKVLTIKLRAKK